MTTYVKAGTIYVDVFVPRDGSLGVSYGVQADDPDITYEMVRAALVDLGLGFAEELEAEENTK